MTDDPFSELERRFFEEGERLEAAREEGAEPEAPDESPDPRRTGLALMRPWLARAAALLLARLAELGARGRPALARLSAGRRRTLRAAAAATFGRRPDGRHLTLESDPID
jgi:hypothetical protein